MRFSILFFLLMGSEFALGQDEVLVYRNESMPWCGTVNGEDAGITVDILDAITRNGGPKFSYLSLPWKRAQLMAQKNENAAIIPLTRTTAREEKYLWIAQLVPNQVRLTTARSRGAHVAQSKLISVNEAKSKRAGIILGSAYIPQMKEMGFTRLVEFKDARELVKHLRSGFIEVMVESKGVDTYSWKALGETELELVPGPHVGEPKYIYLAAAPDFPDDMTVKIRNAMAVIRKNGELQKIYDKWL